MSNFIYSLIAGLFELKLIKSLIFRFSNYFVRNFSSHSLQYTDLGAAIFQSYDIFEKFMDRIIFEDHKAIKNFLKPFFVNLISINFRENRTPIEMHIQIIGLLYGVDRKISKKEAIPVNTDSDSKRKILFVTSMFPSFLHGGGLRIFDIIDSLAENNDIYLFSTFVDGLDEESYTYLKHKLKLCKLIRVKDYSGNTFSKWYDANQTELGMMDVVHLEYHESIPLINHVRPVAKKVIFTYMECLSLSYYLRWVSSADFRKTYFSDDLERFLHFAVLEKFALENCDEVIAVTDHDAKFISKFANSTPKVINHCVSDFSIWRKIPNAIFTSISNSVCFVANFQHPPNIEAMLWYLGSVHPRVKETVPDCKVLIVGSGNTERLQKISMADQNIIYTGYVEDIVPHILSSTVCISPLISGAGLRGKVNQYAACGKVSVNTSISLRGLPYTHMKDTLIADDPREYSDAVIELLTDARLRKKLETNAFQLVKKHFFWESKIKELVSLY